MKSGEESGEESGEVEEESEERGDEEGDEKEGWEEEEVEEEVEEEAEEEVKEESDGWFEDIVWWDIGGDLDVWERGGWGDWGGWRGWFWDKCDIDPSWWVVVCKECWLLICNLL